MNITTRKTNAFYGNTPIDQMRVIKNEGDWDIDEANTFTNNISTQFFNNIGEQDIKLQLVYYFRDTNFFVSSKFFGKEQGFQAPSTDNYDFDENLFKNVDMILINRVKPSTEGGNSAKNDCLWRALKQSLGSHLKILPSTLKRHLKLPRNNLIDYRLMPKIEDKVKANINVVGDYTLTSTKDYPFKCSVELKANHYTYKPNRTVFEMLYSQPSSKTLMVYENLNKTQFLCYDGVEEKAVEKTNLIQHCRDNKLNAVKRTIFPYKGKNIQQIFFNLHKQAEALKQLSNGVVDVTKYGFDMVKTAKSLFYTTNKSIQFDTITSNEETFLRDSKLCGMMYVEKGVKKHMKCYDYNQFYPYLLTRTNTYKLPVGTPVITSLEELPTILSFGLYKVKIDVPTNCKFMIRNSNNVYTHYDIKVAREMGYGMELIEGQNACLYKTKRLYPSQIFNDYMELLFKYKTKDTKKIVKRLMNCLWGSLSQKNWITHDLRKPLVVDDLKQLRIRVNANRTRVVADVIRSKTFKYPHARMSPFITSLGRFIMFQTIKPFHEQVYRIHTDGFYCDSGVVLPTGNKIGQLKLEMEGTVEWIHLNKKVIH